MHFPPKALFVPPNDFGEIACPPQCLRIWGGRKVCPPQHFVRPPQRSKDLSLPNWGGLAKISVPPSLGGTKSENFQKFEGVLCELSPPIGGDIPPKRPPHDFQIRPLRGGQNFLCPPPILGGDYVPCSRYLATLESSPLVLPR